MKKNNILVVEDEAFIAHDIKKILDKEGYNTIIDCFNVDQAIQMVQGRPFDLLLIDINLNDRKNGLDLAGYLDKVVQIPYLFITSYCDKTTLSKVSGHKAAAYITKPFKTQDLISSVFLVLSRNSNAQITEQNEKAVPYAITQVLIYIEQNLREKLDLNMLAALTEWEPEHFGRIFKEHIGMTPYQYILKSKIERSKELLAQSNDSSQTICFELGFSNYSNFFNAFKKHVRMSPDQYRKLVK